MAVRFDLKRYFVLICLGLSLIANVFLWVFLVWKMGSLGEEAILHYDVLQGIDLIGPGQDLLLLPLMGLIIIGLNFFLGAWGIKRNRLMAQILAGIALAVQFVLIVSACLMIHINAQYV